MNRPLARDPWLPLVFGLIAIGTFGTGVVLYVKFRERDWDE